MKFSSTQPRLSSVVPGSMAPVAESSAAAFLGPPGPECATPAVLVGRVVPQFELAKLVNISTITRVDEWGLYYYSYWDYKPTFTSLGGHHLV